MSNPKILPAQAGHQMPPLKPAKERGVPRLALSQKSGGPLTVGLEGDWTNIRTAAGATELSYGAVMQLATLGEPGHRFSETASNAALAFVSKMKSRDPAELLLLTQMASVHQATSWVTRQDTHDNEDCYPRCYPGRVASKVAQQSVEAKLLKTYIRGW